MLDANIKEQLRTYLERVQQPIELIASLDDSAAASEMREFLQDVAPLSDKVSLREDGTNARRPSFGVARVGEDPRVVFAGIPMGHEFTSLILALLQVGGYAPKVSEEVIEQIRNLKGEFRFETYISLTCHNCPDVVQALNLMAVLNPGVSHIMIDGGLYPQEIETRQIMAVPSIFLNGEPFENGRMELEQILARIDTSGLQREAEKISAKDPFDAIVIGGGPAGSSAAIYLARKGIRTGIVAERFGGQVMDTLAIENFISVKETEGPKLVAALEEHVKSYEVDVMNLQRAQAIIPGELLEIRLQNGGVLKSKSVIVATGARWKELNIPGEKELRGKGVAYCPHCDGPLFKGKKVAVVGGGNSGVEAAIDLAGIVEHVTLLQFDDELKADAILQKKLFSLSNVEVICHAKTTEITGADNKVNGLNYTDRASGESRHIELAAVFVQIGLLPNTDWLKETVNLSQYGEIEVNDHGGTNVPGIFAAGDVTTTPYKQIVIAMGDGAKAALGAFDHLIRQ